MARSRFGNARPMGNGRFQARYTKDGQEYTGPHTYERKSDANRWLALEEAKILKGEWIDPAAGTLRFQDYVDEWWTLKRDLAPGTRDAYLSVLRAHILPHFGASLLRGIRPPEVRRWYSGMQQKRLANATVARAYRLLRQVLQSAVDDELIAQNPCRIKRAGQEHSPERNPPSTATLEAMIETVDERYRALIVMAGYLGLRFGELAGLERRHINPLHKTVTVEQQYARCGTGYEIRPPKTEAGNRTMIMPERVAQKVERHLNTYCTEEPDAPLFTSPSGGRLNRDNFRNRVWYPLRKTVGTPGLRFHDLRHHAGTLAAGSGVPTKGLMQNLGQASPQAALRYQDAAKEHPQQIADHIDAQIEQHRLATSTDLQPT